MKGYLHKTEEGWFIIYDQRTMQDPSAEDGMLPLHPHDVAVFSFSFYNGKVVDFEIIQYDGTIPISNAWNGYAKLIDSYPVSDDCEEVNNWDNFVEQKNKELLAEEYANSKSSSEVFRDAHKEDFITGYNKAIETLYTEEQMVQAIKFFITYKAVADRDVWDKDINLYIRSLKQNKL